MTGRSAVAINALLFVNNPAKFLKIVSLSHRFKIMRVFDLGNPDEFKTYGQEIVLSNRRIIDGFKVNYGIEAEPMALTEFLYSPRAWGRIYSTNIRPPVGRLIEVGPLVKQVEEFSVRQSRLTHDALNNVFR